jgi:hypothetical protein
MNTINIFMKTKTAKGPILWFLETFDYSAITMPWQTVYLRPDRVGPQYQRLLDHESVHIDQIQKMGAVKFTVLYLWYNIRYGYQNNPLEIEARAKSGW